MFVTSVFIYMNPGMNYKSVTLFNKVANSPRNLNFIKKHHLNQSSQKFLIVTSNENLNFKHIGNEFLGFQCGKMGL